MVTKLITRAHHNVIRTQEAFENLQPFRQRLANKIARQQFEKPVKDRISPELILIKVLSSHYKGEKTIKQ